MNQEVQYAIEQLGKNSKHIADSLSAIAGSMKLMAMKELVVAIEGPNWYSTYTNCLLHFRKDVAKSEKAMKEAEERYGAESDDHRAERSFWHGAKANLERWEEEHPVLVKFANLLEKIEG
jgi:hypothetical protein